MRSSNKCLVTFYYNNNYDRVYSWKIYFFTSYTLGLHLKLIGFANFSPHFVQNVFVNFQLIRDLAMPAIEESFKLKFAKIVLRSLKEDLDISSFLIFLLKNFT